MLYDSSIVNLCIFLVGLAVSVYNEEDYLAFNDNSKYLAAKLMTLLDRKSVV